MLALDWLIESQSGNSRSPEWELATRYVKPTHTADVIDV
jgi:hypothetical protein